MIDVEIEDVDWTAVLPEAETLVRRAAETALAADGVVGDVTVLLTSDLAVRELNATFRGKDYATNVLSFPAPANPEAFVGDIALALGVMTREAAEQGKPLAHHLQHLVVHGVLHLIGYDHETDGDADRMESLERALLDGLGVPDPYVDDAP
ncbi:rRNA maturation RNase YbeY [Caulobacter sp. KR2-114]|uniref:rRNA maturation RNase YbeY n=1 Tax=Caulobacter sp. KR2-114 TaxID=3400912 RepID=UPI003BFAA674